MLENREHGRHPRRLPDQIAEAVTAGQQELIGVEHLNDFARRTTLQKCLEHQRQASLGFLVGDLLHCALAGADQARGQCQGQLAARGLLDEPGGEAGFHGVPLPFRQSTFQA
jgi:hypothetical protein